MINLTVKTIYLYKSYKQKENSIIKRGYINIHTCYIVTMKRNLKRQINVMCITRPESYFFINLYKKRYDVEIVFKTISNMGMAIYPNCEGKKLNAITGAYNLKRESLSIIEIGQIFNYKK